MKRISLLFTILSFTYIILISNEKGPNIKVSGAPGDVGTCTNCHTALQGCRFSANSDSVAIIFGNNLTKYKPDSTYTIKVRIGTSNNKGGSSGVTKAVYGFQATAKRITNAGKDSAGLFIAPTGQKIINGGYISHDNFRYGTLPEGHIFTFQWKAPSKADYKDTVRFYTATNEAYHSANPSPSDDSIRTKMLVITCDTAVSTVSLSKSASNSVSLSTNFIYNQIVVPNAFINKEFMIINVNGQIVRKGKAEQVIDVATLNSGFYYFQSENSVTKFYKN